MTSITKIKECGPKLAFLALIIPVLTILPLNKAKAKEPTCQITPQPDRIIVTFNQRIFGNRDQAQAMSKPVNITLEPGYYRVTLQSYDKRPSETGISQPSENWHAILSNNKGKTITTSSSIGDLPDNTNTLTEITDQNLLVAQTVSEITAFHSNYPTKGPNSVDAVCAAFDFMDKAPEPQDAAISTSAAISTTTPSPQKTTPITANTGVSSMHIIAIAFLASTLVITTSFYRFQKR